MKIGIYKVLQTMVKIREVFPKFPIKKVRRIDQDHFITESQSQVNGVVIMKLSHLKPNDLKKYKQQLLLPKHDFILQIKGVQYFQKTKELIIITQQIDKKLNEYAFSQHDQLMEMLNMMQKITEGCLYLQDNYPCLLVAIEYDCIFLNDKIPKIQILGFVKWEQELKSLKISFRQTMMNIGILFLSLICQQRIDTHMGLAYLQKEVKSIKNHDLMIMINEMIFNENQIQTPTFDDILVYLTRIKYKNMDFKGIKMDIEQVYSHYCDSSRYLTDQQQLIFLKSYQQIIEGSAQQQNTMALFLLAKMLALKKQQNKQSQQPLQKIKNLYLSAYQKGEKFSAIQLYWEEQQFDQNGQINGAKEIYLIESIKRQDQRSYVQMEWLRFYGFLGIMKQSQKALKNLQNSKINHINLYIILLKLYLEHHNYQKAQKYIAKCFAYGRNVDVLKKLFYFWSKQKQYLKSIECLKKFIKYLSKNKSDYIDKVNEAYYWIGKSYQQKGNNIQSKQWYQRCLSQQNQFQLRALIRLSRIDDKNQINYLNYAIMLENDSANNLSVAYHNLGIYNSYYTNPAKQRQNIGKAIQYLLLAQSLGDAEGSIQKGKLISRQTHELNNKNLSIQILYQSHKQCNLQLKQKIQNKFKDAIEDDDD